MKKISKQKGSIMKILIILLTISLLYFLIPAMIHSYKESYGKNISTIPELTQEQARTLVIRTWGDCTPDTCSKVVVTTEKKKDGWYITAIYEGLLDDSVEAQRKIVPATYVNGAWIIGNPSITYRCQKNRGHQDFSDELCL